VLGADDGDFPHRLAADVEEERRVFHVAITRARDDVVVLADNRSPSPFCAELTGTAPRRPPPQRSPTGTRSTAATPTKPAARAPSVIPGVTAEVGLVVHTGDYNAPIVDIDDAGVIVVPDGGSARIALPWGSTVTVSGRPARLMRPGLPSPEEALAALKAWRKQTAQRDRVPAYVVFSDEHLTGIAEVRPSSMSELAGCRGIGPTKLDRYGDEILATLQSVGA
jgi:hypothetical protein